MPYYLLYSLSWKKLGAFFNHKLRIIFVLNKFWNWILLRPWSFEVVFIVVNKGTKLPIFHQVIFNSYLVFEAVNFWSFWGSAENQMNDFEKI